MSKTYNHVTVLTPAWDAFFVDNAFLLIATGSPKKPSSLKDLSIVFNDKIDQKRARILFDKMKKMISAIKVYEGDKEKESISTSDFSVEDSAFCSITYQTNNVCLLTTELFECNPDGEVRFYFELKDDATIIDLKRLQDEMRASVKEIHFISANVTASED